MTLKTIKLAVLALLAVPILLLQGAHSAAALDFRCVEPSRYRNLLQIFNDDPTAFFSYFNLARRPLPPHESCRALLVTGTIGDGAADALLDRVIEGRGWLGVLYLSFDGTNVEEEAKLATVVRQFSLKTYEVRGPVYFYQPDFAVRWTPTVGKAGLLSAGATNDPSSLDAGLAAFMNRRDRVLKLDPNRYACADGCRVVWAAGVNRQNNSSTAKSVAPDPADKEAVARLRLRTVLSYRIDRNRLPAANEPLLSRPWEQIPPTPPATADALRKECDAEMSVAAALEARFGDVFTEAIGKKLTPTAVTSLIPHLNGLKRAGFRLQQCLAAAHEKMRLARYEAQCPKTCDRAALRKSLAKSARDLLDGADAI